mmetsp:Transcript_19212/g.53790  ORF Transcript_19212/g.53790 Transcript_19212/m.53790 type:complete len:247 (+) Transcript_19212:773-1513(+)
MLPAHLERFRHSSTRALSSFSAIMMSKSRNSLAMRRTSSSFSSTSLLSASTVGLSPAPRDVLPEALPPLLLSWSTLLAPPGRRPLLSTSQPVPNAPSPMPAAITPRPMSFGKKKPSPILAKPPNSTLVPMSAPTPAMRNGTHRKDSAKAPKDKAAPTAAAAKTRPMMMGPIEAANASTPAAGTARVQRLSLLMLNLLPLILISMIRPRCEMPKPWLPRSSPSEPPLPLLLCATVNEHFLVQLLALQ